MNKGPGKKRHHPLHGKETDRSMNTQQSDDPLHGITLEQIVKSLVAHYGWNELGNRIDIRCFTSDPSVKSTLTFLRKTPWARKKVENIYIALWRKRKKQAPAALSGPGS